MVICARKPVEPNELGNSMCTRKFITSIYRWIMDRMEGKTKKIDEIFHEVVVRDDEGCGIILSRYRRSEGTV